MGEGGRGEGNAQPERRSREWSTCVPCRNLNRIKNFGANNFDIKRLCTFHTITSPRRQLVYKNTKTFSRIDISLSSNETVCTECGNEITDPSKRRKLFNLSTTRKYFFKKRIMFRSNIIIEIPDVCN